MIKLKTIIVDDEYLARQLLKSNLSDIAEIDIVAECENGRQAIQAAMQHNPDLIFLDIQMPGINGFEVVKALQADIMPMIIFTTAFDKYAVKAFDISAVDYILKPLEEKLVERAVQRALTCHSRDRVLNDTKQHLLEALEQLGHSFQLIDKETTRKVISPNTNHFSDKLAIRDGGSTTLVPMNEIDWIDAAGDFMCIHCNGKTHVMRSTMKDLVEQLDPRIFKRIHRSTVLNLEKIEKSSPHIKGEYFVHLQCGEQLKVSRSYGDIIRNYIDSISH